MPPQKILFGTAGIPISTKTRDSVSGIERVKELGLGAMELEFVRGIHMSEETAKEVAKAAKKLGIALSVHAPYFINLNSREKEKVSASRKRIMESARIGEKAGAEIVTFHPAYFQGEEKKKVLEKVAGEIAGMADEIRSNGWEISLAPETTGRETQLGSLEETLEMCKRVRGVLPMVDFAHLHARSNGRFKAKKDFIEAIECIPKKYLANLHMHASGIRFSEKGERNHLDMQDEGNSFNYQWFLEALREKMVSGKVICESPSIEGDALLMKKYWEKIG